MLHLQKVKNYLTPCLEGSRSQKPMHDNSDGKISGTATDMNNDKQDQTPAQSIGYLSDATPPDAPADDEHLGLNERSSAAFSGHESDGKFSNTVSDNEYHIARETIPANRLNYDSDATISDPELEDKDENVLNMSGPLMLISMIVEDDSDTTISDPELEDKYEHVLNMSGPLILVDHDSEKLISIPQSNVDVPRDSSSAATVQCIAKRNKNKVNKASRKMPSSRHRSLCKQTGHIRTACPTILCKYKGCNKTVYPYCHKLSQTFGA